MNNHLTSIHELDANATPSKEKWLTQCGVFKATAKGMLEKMKLPQFTTKITVTAEMNLFERTKEDPYDFILGRNLLQDIKLDIKSRTRTVAWDEIEIPMVKETKKQKQTDSFSLGGEYHKSETPYDTEKSPITKDYLF